MITKIEMLNFKDRSAAISLGERTVILGPVGSGKSTIIEAVRLALGLPTRHGSTKLDTLSSSGSWQVSATVRGHVITRSQSPGKAMLSIDGIAVSASDFKSKLAAATGIGAVPDVDLGEFLAKSGQERAALFGRLLANDAVTMEEAVVGATGMSVVEYIKACSGRDIGTSPWTSVRGTPSEIVDQTKVMLNEMRAKARDAEAHLRELLSKPPGETKDLALLQKELETRNLRRGEVRGKIDGIANSLNAKKMAESQLARLDEMIESAKRRAADIEGAIPDKLAEIDALVPVAIAAASEKVAAANEGARLTLLLQEAKNQRVATPPGDPLGNVGDPSPMPHEDVVRFREAVGLHDAEVAALGVQLIELVVKPWIEAHRRACVEAIEAHAVEQKAVAAKIAELEAAVAKQLRLADTALKRAEDADRQAKEIGRLIESSRQEVVRLRQEAEKMEASRAKLMADAQAVVIAEDQEVLEAETRTLDEQVRSIEEDIRAAQRASQIKGQIDRAQLDHGRAEALVETLKSLEKKLQEWRDNITKAAMDAVLGPFRGFVGLVLPGAGVDIRIAGSGRSTSFDFVVVRDGKAVLLDHLSAGETALVGAAFLAAMHSIMGSEAKLLTMDAEALDAQSMQRLLAAVPVLGFDSVLIASNRLGPGEVPPDWRSYEC